MSAVVVHDMDKKFETPGGPFWKQTLRLNGKENVANGHSRNGNGHSGNGHSSNGKDPLLEPTGIDRAENSNPSGSARQSRNANK